MSDGSVLAEPIDLSTDIPPKPESKGGKLFMSAAITAGAGLGLCALGIVVASHREEASDDGEGFNPDLSGLKYIQVGCTTGVVVLGVAAVLAIGGVARKADSWSKRRQWEKKYGKLVSKLNVSLQLPTDESRRTQVFVGVNF